MNGRSIALWGFVGTVVLTGFMAASQGLHQTRMNIPYMLGTMVTADRERAKFVGILVHMMNGWLFATIYALAFESWRRSSPLHGAAIGTIHGAFVLAAGMPVMPAMHPRMASESSGPTPTRQLEPPGFLALNYGRRTPVSVMLAHILYGAVLGAGYQRRNR
jgi:uncharacterized membrane protein YagU involved in acid resistance